MNVLKFVHITDTHLLDQSDDVLHNINTKERLEKVLSHSQTQYPDIDFFLITGDISQTGSEESYIIFKSVIEQYNFPVHCVPGNHDTPELLNKIVPGCPDKSINIIKLGNFSLVLINSWVEGEHYGKITQNCLQQLEEHLKNSKEQFNIIAIHHPPVLINSEWLDELRLHNQSDFLQIINMHHQRILLLCGHVHQEVDRKIENLRLLSTPSTCHQYQAGSKSMRCIDLPLPAYRFVKLTSLNNIVTKVHYLEYV